MTYPLIKAKHFTLGRSGKKIRQIVIHTMETPETEGRAKQVAYWFAGPTAPQASAHYCVDNKEIYQTVLDTDTAWAVDQFDANQASLSIELAGSSSQTQLQWNDAYSKGELDLAAHLCAELAVKYNIPVVKLQVTSVKFGSGFIGHNDVTTAYNIAGGHTDPGHSFPWKDFLALVQTKVNTLKGGK